MSRLSVMRWQKPIVTPLFSALAVLGCVILAVMGYELSFLFFSLFTMLVLGVPIAVSLAGSCLMFVLLTGQVPNVVVAHRMINGIDSFPLLAIPFFIFAGSLMNNAGITERIFNFAKALMGWMRGGLGHVNVGASIVFSGMSGAAVADAGGLGTIEVKAMKDAGYDEEFAVGITAASSTIGPIIPPSLPMVIYGVMASASVGQLFAAGLIPGLLMGAMLMLMIFLISRRRGYTRDATFSVRVLGHSFARAFLSLMKDEGVTRMFGNPGTTDLPIMHALTEQRDIGYVLGLQEAVVIAMADGFARASGQLVSCNVHVAPGLGNAIGSIYTANVSGTPMIVTAGQQEQGHAQAQAQTVEAGPRRAVPEAAGPVELRPAGHYLGVDARRPRVVAHGHQSRLAANPRGGSDLRFLEVHQDNVAGNERGRSEPAIR